MKTLDYYLRFYNIELTYDSGKEIARTKDLLFTHTGIILGKSKNTGRKIVFHNHPDSGPAIVDFSTYANGFVSRYTERPSDAWQIVLLRSFRQAESGADYKLMAYNCQDATSYSRDGNGNSHGRNNAVAAVSILAIFALLSKL